MGNSHRANVIANGENDDPATYIPNSATTSPTTSKKPDLRSVPEQLVELSQAKATTERKEKGTTAKMETQIEHKTSMNIGCWNVRRGLIKQELAIKELLEKENLDVLFLVETDTKSITCEKDYQISGYNIFFRIIFVTFLIFSNQSLSYETVINIIVLVLKINGIQLPLLLHKITVKLREHDKCILK